jgi:hypothetical protein
MRWILGMLRVSIGVIGSGFLGSVRFGARRGILVGIVL